MGVSNQGQPQLTLNTLIRYLKMAWSKRDTPFKKIDELLGHTLLLLIVFFNMYERPALDISKKIK